MTHRYSYRASALCFAAALSIFSVPLVRGQAKDSSVQSDDTKNATNLADKDVSQTPSEQEPQELSPFVVESTADDSTYSASSTLAGTRIRTDLNDTAAAISVITSKFLQDTGTNNAGDLLVYTPSTDVSGVYGNYSGYGGSRQPIESNLIVPSNTNRVRGLDAADQTRDYFLTDIPWDSFNTTRIDLQRGPNSILFGLGSPAGIINAGMSDASYVSSYKFEDTIDQYGSFRNNLNFNIVLLPGELAFRVAMLSDDEKFQQKPAFNDQKRLYAALRFDKDFLGKGNTTTVRVKFESGNVSSDNPRTLPPMDQITPWFTTFGKSVVNMFAPGAGFTGSSNPSTLLLESGSGGHAVFPGAAGGSNFISFFTNGNSVPTLVEESVSSWNAGGADSPGNANTYRLLAVPDYATYALYNLPGGSFYGDKTLNDPSIFNYFDNLLDGTNKQEWQNWKAENIDLQQSFWHNRLSFDLTYDRQTYTSGQEGMLLGGYYTLGVDINQTLPDGTTNPNLGDPYVAGASGNNANQSTTLRESKRGIATADLKSSDLFGKGWLANLLGRHVLTGLVNQDSKYYQTDTWSQYATTTSAVDLLNNGDTTSYTYNSIAGARTFDFIDYLGPTLLNSSSASGANLQSIGMTLSPAGSSVGRYFNNTWNAPTVSLTAPYSYTSATTGLPVATQQSENPANYVGWSSGNLSWLNASNPAQLPSLVTAGDKQIYIDNSVGFTWQGYLLDGDLIPTFGWRKDRVFNNDTTALPNTTTGIAPLQYNANPEYDLWTAGESRNWSGVFHVPHKLTGMLVKGMDITVGYDTSSNFEADTPRRNLLGAPIPNPQGHTREKNITVSLLDGKLVFKANHFRTIDEYATLGAGAGNILGSASYYMYQLPTLGYVEAAMIQDQLNGNDPGGWGANNVPGWTNYAYADGVTGVNKTDNLTNTSASSAFQQAAQTQGEESAVAAWLKAPSILTPSFYQFWGEPGSNLLNPAAAASSGQLHSAFSSSGGVLNDFLYFLSIYQGGTAGTPVSTVDTVSQGWEFEMTANPIKGWNIFANFVKISAERDNLDSTTVSYLTDLNGFFEGPAGYVRLWGLPSYQINALWKDNIWLPYQVTLSGQGQQAPEVAPWRVNIFTSYAFQEGSLKGFTVGGGLRITAPQIDGYNYSAALGYLNVNAPIHGPEDTHLDLFVGYRRKLDYRILGHSLVWSTQINLRNAFERTELVPASYEPDGSVQFSRIQEGMLWRWSNSLEF